MFGELPWYMALTVAGEDSIERNLIHPKSKGSASDSDDPTEWEGLPDWRCVGGTKFPNPEEYVIEKENEAERRKEHREALTKRQQDIYELYFEIGKTRHEIADELGISQRAVGRLIDRIVLRLQDQ